MEVYLNDGIAGLNVGLPESPLTESAEGLDETIKLDVKGKRRMFEREGLELPFGVGFAFHEIEDASGCFGLDSAAADWTDSQLAGFGLEEQLSGFNIL